MKKRLGLGNKQLEQQLQLGSPNCEAVAVDLSATPAHSHIGSERVRVVSSWVIPAPWDDLMVSQVFNHEAGNILPKLLYLLSDVTKERIT